MPEIRVERIAIRTFFLGVVGFDHLQLVFDPQPGTTCQDEWFVIEGVRDPAPDGPILGVQGTDGRLTLARANAAARSDLVLKIGTPEQRGSTVIASGWRVCRLWQLLASEAAEIDDQRLPYVAIARPAGIRPARNSSSVVATLLHRAGFDVPACLPPSVRFVPGIETLIAPSAQQRTRPASYRDRHGWLAARRHGNSHQTDQNRKWYEPWDVSGSMSC